MITLDLFLPTKIPLTCIGEPKIKRNKESVNDSSGAYSPATVQYSTQAVFQQDLGIQI